MAEFASSSRDRSYRAALLVAVDPLIYRRNAFRLSGLRVDANTREIRRRGDELRALARLGTTTDTRPRPLPLDPPADLASVEDALQALRNPERRLIDELFWFWPGPEDPTGLAWLADGDLEAAATQWQERMAAARQNRFSAAVALHNLAVLYHAQALDLEFAGDGADAAGLWTEAYSHWHAVTEVDECWQWLDGRIRELDDPRLAGRATDDLRAALPSALLSINATLAVRALDPGEQARQRRHRQLETIEDAPFPDEAIDEALEKVSEPIVARIRSACQTATDAVNADTTRGARAAATLLDQVEPLLEMLDDVHGAGDPVRDGVRDEVALCALGCSIAHHSEAQDHDAAYALVERIQPLATTEPTIVRITENLELLRGFRQTRHWMTHCWFCGASGANESDWFQARLLGQLTRTSGGVGWPTGTMPIPRCANCRTEHERVEQMPRKFGIVAVLGSILAVICTFTAGIAWYLLALTLIGILIVRGVIRARSAAALRMVDQRVRDFPPIVEAAEDDWHYVRAPT
jgi:hypothetical protein